MANLNRGYEFIDNFLSEKQLLTIKKELESLNLPPQTGGIRNAEKKFESVEKLVHSQYVLEYAKQYLAATPKLVRAILFNKTPENNWLVTWHQDKTVAVSNTFENHHWGPWSIKDQTHHVQPPLKVLNQIVTFRIHIDSSDQNNGCLKVIPNSHKKGIINSHSIQEYVSSHTPILCEAKQGSALVMRPHILHASSKATKVSQRRVLHLEYSSYQLPTGIYWA